MIKTRFFKRKTSSDDIMAFNLFMDAFSANFDVRMRADYDEETLKE